MWATNAQPPVRESTPLLSAVDMDRTLPRANYVKGGDVIYDDE